MKKWIGILIVCFGFFNAALAQPENAQVETINGKKYYVHIVQQGNTLYGIHQLYNTSIESILDANQGMTNDLALGQKILIPISTSDAKHYGKHKVAQGETLYGISKQYNCSIEDLKGLNDNLSEGLSIGQEIIVPIEGAAKENGGERIQTDPISQNTSTPENRYAVSLKDSIVIHTVLAHETMYSISKRYMVSQDTIMAVNGLRNTKLKKGDQLKIPVKQVNYTVLEKDLNKLNPQDSINLANEQTEFKPRYSVALLLPLLLDKNDQEMGKPLKLDQVREMYGTTKISFDFYQGFVLAADSLTKAGLSVDIYVYDTQKDTNAIKKILARAEFTNMDLVVGPLYNHTIKFTAKECAKRKIRMVLPFNADEEVVYKNPYVFKGVASDMTLLDGSVDYIIKHHKQHNIILIKPKSTADIALYERVKKRFNDSIKRVNGAYNMHIIESSLGSSSGRELNAIIKSDTTNIVIIPSTDLTFVSSAMSTLNKVCNLNPYAKNLRIISFGLEDWNKYDDLDLKYRNRTTQHYASYRYLDYEAPQTVKFIKAFRGSFGTDPNVYSSQGFDFGYYFLSAMYLYGTNFDVAMKKHRMELIQNNFEFEQIEPGSGWENKRVCIVKYDNFVLYRLQ